MCSFYQPGCTAIIDAFPTFCVDSYDKWQDQEVFIESEIASAALRETLDNACPPVCLITLAYPGQFTNIVLDAEGQMTSWL